MQQWQYLLQWVLPGWLLLHVKRVRHRVLQVSRIERQVPNLRDQSLPRRRLQMLAKEQPARRRPVLGQRLVRQRVLRWWPLLCVVRICFRLLRMRLFERKVSHMPVKPLPQRRFQMLAEK